MREIMDQVKMTRYMEGSYVDDIRYVVSRLDPGVKWCQKKRKFLYKEEWEKEDIECGESDTRRTASELCKAMNSIYHNIKFTVETEEDFNGRLPTLDVELWMEEVTGQRRKKINYSFFEEKLKTPYCVMRLSAMPASSKISILSQDLVRRMMNCSETVPQSERNGIVNLYIDRLVTSGYDKNQVREIIESGLLGYEKKLERARKAKIPLHRPASFSLASRQKKKLTQKTNWYKAKPKNKTPPKKHKATTNKKMPKPLVSLIFVPKTVDGDLSKRLREIDRKISEVTGDQCKVVERSGTKLKQLLHKSNPWQNVKCGREKFLICNCPS